MEYSFANLSKYTAYKEIASNYDEARALLESKKLAYGEGAVVSFYFPGRSAEVKTIEQMLGVGGIDGNIMVYSNILGADSRVDDATIFLASKNKTVKLSEAFDIITESIDDRTLTAIREIKASIDAQTVNDAEKLGLINVSLAKLGEIKTSIDEQSAENAEKLDSINVSLAKLGEIKTSIDEQSLKLGEMKASIDAQSTKNAEKLDLLNETLEKMIEAIKQSHIITVAQAVN